MGVQADLEKQMESIFVKNAPFQIPENGRKAIAKYLPVISLVFGVLSLLAALSLWNAARKVDDLVETANQFARVYGIDNGLVDYGTLYYIALIALVVQGVLMLVAYKPLSQKLKKGWDLVLLGVLLSLVFGVLYLFTDSGFISNLIGSLVGAIIGLYVLAQIRGQYKTVVTKPEK
jgi:hypothetical protein